MHFTLFQKNLTSYADWHISIAQTFCSSCCRCRKAGPRCCSRQWKMFSTTASQFSFSVIVRSWPENWPIYSGVTWIPSLSWNAQCILSNDGHKDHNAPITIENLLNLTNVGCIQLSPAYAAREIHSGKTAVSNATPCMSKTTEITLAILPLLSPKTALANTKRPANSTEFIRSHQTPQSHGLKVEAETQRVCSLLYDKLCVIREGSQFDAEKPL